MSKKLTNINIGYFSHDVHSRTDQKMKLLIRKYKMEGYGIYWAILEDLYINANALRLDYCGIAEDLKTNPEIVEDIINNFELFVICNEFLKSNGVQKRIKKIKEKSLKASKSASYRWNKENANALQSHSDSNAIKLNKIKLKETKLKELGEDAREPVFENNFLLEKNGKKIFNISQLPNVVAYFDKLRMTPDQSKHFLDHYDSIGWKKNGQEITDWKSLANLWKRRQAEIELKNPTGKSKSAQSDEMQDRFAENYLHKLKILKPNDNNSNQVQPLEIGS